WRGELIQSRLHRAGACSTPWPRSWACVMKPVTKARPRWSWRPPPVTAWKANIPSRFTKVAARKSICGLRAAAQARRFATGVLERRDLPKRLSSRTHHPAPGESRLRSFPEYSGAAERRRNLLRPSRGGERDDSGTRLICVSRYLERSLRYSTPPALEWHGSSSAA